MRTVALGVAILSLSACVHEYTTARNGEPVGLTSTTSAAMTTTSDSAMTPGGCATDLPHVFDFQSSKAELSGDERVDLQSWATCLNRPEMRDSTVVLLGGMDAKDESLFPRRAEAVRDELVKRGVELSRIVIGTPNASREGGKIGPSNAVQLEVTGSTTLRSLNERR